MSEVENQLPDSSVVYSMWLTTEADDQSSLHCALCSYANRCQTIWGVEMQAVEVDGGQDRCCTVHRSVWIGLCTIHWRPSLDLRLVCITDRVALHPLHSDVHKVSRLARSLTEYPHRCWRSRTGRQCPWCHHCFTISRQVCPLYCCISALLFFA